MSNNQRRILMHYIGIDPGKGGGIAVLNGDGSVLWAVKMPETPHDLFASLLKLPYALKSRAVLERVNAGVFGAHKGVGRMGVSSAFTFGRGYGRLEMALAAVRIPYDEVAPATWQAAMQCRSAGDKNVTKRRAQQLFPTITVTHALADALLLAEYCRRQERADVKESREAPGSSQATGQEAGHQETRNERIRPAGAGRGQGIACLTGTAFATAPRHGAGTQRQAR